MSAVAGRHFGAAPSGETNIRQLGDRFNRFVGEAWSQTVGGLPTGYGISGVVPPIKPGSLASYKKDLALSNLSVNCQEGRSLAATTSISFTVQNAGLELQVLLVGSTSLSISVNASNLQLLAEISGNTSLDLTNPAASLSALAGLFASVTFSINPEGTLTATGELDGHIVPSSAELTPENLAAAVWEAIGADHNTAGTMGEKLNSAADNAELAAVT